MLTSQAAPGDAAPYLHQKTLAVRSSLALSPDGQWIAVVTQGLPSGKAAPSGQDEAEPVMTLSEEVAGSEVVVVNTQTGQAQHPFSDFNVSCLPAWSPDGKWLALLTQDGERCYPRLTLWSPDETEATPVVFEVAPMSPLTSFQALRWTSDSRKVLFIQTDTSTREKPLVDHVTAQQLDEDRASQFYNQQSLGVFDITSRQVTGLGQMTMTWAARLSPDNQHAAALRYTYLPDKPQNTQANWRQLVVMNLDDGTEQCVGEPQTDTWGSSFAWSPDGGAIAWLAVAHHSPTKLYVAELKTEPRLREVALPDDAQFGFTSVGWYPPPAPRWNRDGQSFYLPGQAKLWRFTRDGAVDGTIPLPDGDKFDWLANSITALDFPGMHSIDEAGEVWLWRPNEVWKVNLATGDAVLVWKRNTDAPPRRNFGIERALDVTSQVLYTAHTSAEGVIEVYGTALSSGETGVVATLMQSTPKCRYGPIHSLSWTLPDGTHCGGTLLLPIGWQEGDKAPVVMTVYGGSIGKGNLSIAAIEDDSMVASAHLLSVNGYAVLIPDMSQQDEQPLASLVIAGEAAVRALRESDLVDTERVAVMGSSYGGYTTLCLLTGSKLFKAGVAANGIYDLLRSATDGDWGWAETGQGRMRTSVWENPTRYIENSPLYALDQLEAPLLVLRGGADAGTLRQGEALFTSLRRLGKRSEMLTYRDAGHAPRYWSITAQRDWHQRLLAFLNEHLRS